MKWLEPLFARLPAGYGVTLTSETLDPKQLSEEAAKLYDPENENPIRNYSSCQVSIGTRAGAEATSIASTEFIRLMRKNFAAPSRQWIKPTGAVRTACQPLSEADSDLGERIIEHLEAMVHAWAPKCFALNTGSGNHSSHILTIQSGVSVDTGFIKFSDDQLSQIVKFDQPITDSAAAAAAAAAPVQTPAPEPTTAQFSFGFDSGGDGSVSAGFEPFASNYHPPTAAECGFGFGTETAATGESAVAGGIESGLESICFVIWDAYRQMDQLF